MEKQMHTLAAQTSREIKQWVNELEIKKEDIVSLIYVNSQFLLFYYK